MPDLLSSLSWEDFRMVSMVAETGGLSPAADRLGQSRSTLFRRLAKLEETVGGPLFERVRGAYVATPAGEEMLSAADAMATEAAVFASRIEGRQIKPAGELRIATSDALMLGLMTPVLGSFRRAYPAVRLEVSLGNRALNLTRRDADVALRATRRPPESLVGRRLATLGWALYAGASNPASRDWLALSDELSDLPAAEATARAMGEARPVWQVNSVAALADAIAQGAGRGFLPCFIGDARADLRRLGRPLASLASELWVLTHPDLKRAPRVRAFLDHAANELTYQRTFLAGLHPPSYPDD